MCTRHPQEKAVALLFGIVLVAPLVRSQFSERAYTHSRYLDAQGKYLLEWSVDWDTKEVTFNVTASTRGYVGLGLSKKGKMSGADIVIGGVYKNGKPYFSDRHAVANQFPSEDVRQDWILKAARENRTHTHLSFSRKFDTCDEDHDLPIGDDFIAVIWAYGETDDMTQYHFQNRGVFNVYLLDPDLTPPQVQNAVRKNERMDRLRDSKVWTISNSERLSSRDTSYLCTFHKAPNLNRKHHIIGFRNFFPSEKDRRHVHHSTLFRCRVPPGQSMSDYYDPLLNRAGGTCFLLAYTNPVPTHYCSEIVHEFAVGATPIFFPGHVGIPLAESPDEYYMYQVHYDNPQMRPDLTINTHLEIYYTDNVREHDAGVMFIGTNIPGSPAIMIPPNAIEHEIYGHCGSGCTKTMFPPEGIQVFAGRHHTHLAGAKSRIAHIRNNRELPYLLNDDNYNFNYQTIRLLPKERTLLPGDAIVKRCVYTNADTNGTTTVGGLSTSKEMCSGFFWYYPLVRTGVYSFCLSEMRSPMYEEFLGITNTTWSQDRVDNVVTAPAENAGLTVQEVGNKITWTNEKRRQLQSFHRDLPQINICPDGSPEFTIPPTSPTDGFYLTTRLNLFLNVFYDNKTVPYRPGSTCWK